MYPCSLTDVCACVVSNVQAIVAYSRMERLPNALALLTRMESKGVVPDVFSYNCAISACDKSRNWHQAVEVLELMQQKGLEPNLASYRYVISL